MDQFFGYIYFTTVCIIGVLTFCGIRPMNYNENNLNINDNDKTIQFEMQLMLDSTDTTDKTLTNSNINVTYKKMEDANMESDDDHDIQEIIIEHRSIKAELLQSGKKMIHVFKQFNFWSMVPFNMYSGLEMAFDSADFPTLIIDNTSKFYILGYYGLISVLSSLLLVKYQIILIDYI